MTCRSSGLYRYGLSKKHAECHLTQRTICLAGQFIYNPSQPTVQRILPAATGKANFEFARTAQLDGTVFLVIDREAEETCNTGLFLVTFGPG